MKNILNTLVGTQYHKDIWQIGVIQARNSIYVFTYTAVVTKSTKIKVKLYIVLNQIVLSHTT